MTQVLCPVIVGRDAELHRAPAGGGDRPMWVNRSRAGGTAPPANARPDRPRRACVTAGRWRYDATVTAQPDPDRTEDEVRRFLEEDRPDIAERLVRYERDRRAGTLSPGVPHEEVRRRMEKRAGD